jgi:hypothetical protein
MPPTGRARNPTPRVANDASVAEAGFRGEKNCEPKTRAAAVE